MQRDLKSEALKLHQDNSGKIAVRSKIELKDTWDLSLAYLREWPSHAGL